jgi:hypothetical protein
MSTLSRLRTSRKGLRAPSIPRFSAEWVGNHEPKLASLPKKEAK